MHRYRELSLLILILSVMLQGCGFRLAGTGDEDVSTGLSSIALYSTGSSHELVRFTLEYLESNQINVVEPDQAEVLLELLSESAEKEVLTLDRDGKAREFDLALNIEFDVKRPDESYVLSQQSISLNRVFVFDKRDVLGSEEEESRLLDEMRRDAARLIVYRLRAISVQDE